MSTKFTKPISQGFDGSGSELIKIKKKRKRVGRGSGSGMGKTSTRGSNGQKARSGCALRNFEGGQKTITSLPIRGFNSIKKKYKSKIIHIGRILDMIENKVISEKDLIDKDLLMRVNFIKNIKDRVKLLFDVEPERLLNIKLDAYSEAAINAIKAAGGSCN